MCACEHVGPHVHAGRQEHHWLALIRDSETPAAAADSAANERGDQCCKATRSLATYALIHTYSTHPPSLIPDRIWITLMTLVTHCCRTWLLLGQQNSCAFLQTFLWVLSVLPQSLMMKLWLMVSGSEWLRSKWPVAENILYFVYWFMCWSVNLLANATRFMSTGFFLRPWISYYDIKVIYYITIRAVTGIYNEKCIIYLCK